MDIISILSIFSLMLSLYLGLHILLIDKKSETNRIFFFMCLSLALWTFCAIMMLTSNDKKYSFLWLKIVTFGFIPFTAVLFHFCLVLTKIIKIKKIFYLLIYLPTVILMYGNLTSFIVYKNFIKIDNHWELILAKGSPWLIFYTIYLCFNIFLSCLLLFLWYKKTDSIKQKKQALIILITYFITATFDILEGILIPAFTSYNSRGMAQVGMIILMIGIWYAIVKYRFLSITPEFVSKDLIENIDESVILLNDSFNIIKINPATEKLINLKSEDIKSSPISEIISEHKSITDEINNMIKEDHKTFSSRIHYITGNNKNILMDIKFYVIKDKYNDLIGIMLIGKEVKELKQFRSKYKITKRQEEIIRMIINGKLNKEIAQSIGVAESTLKGHITNVYNKLGVTNKIELLNLLKKFNLIPEQPSDKSLLLLKRG